MKFPSGHGLRRDPAVFREVDPTLSRFERHAKKEFSSGNAHARFSCEPTSPKNRFLRGIWRCERNARWAKSKSPPKMRLKSNSLALVYSSGVREKEGRSWTWMGSRPSNYNRMTKFWFSWSGASSPYVTRFYIAKRVWLLCLSRVCPRPSWNNVSRFNWKFFRLFTPPFVSWLPFILLLSLLEREILLIIAFSNDRCEALGCCPF